MRLNSLLSRSFPIITLVGTGFSFSVALIMHWLRPDYNPISRYVSEYAIGQYGEVVAISFTIFGISIVFFYLQLQKVLPEIVKSKIGLRLILLWGISMIIVGFFTCDPKRAQLTVSGIIHLLAVSFGFLVFIIGSWLLSFQFKESTKWRKISTISFVLLLISSITLPPLIVGLIGDLGYAYHFPAPDIFNTFSEIIGLTERILLLSSIIWLSLVTYLSIKEKD